MKRKLLIVVVAVVAGFILYRYLAFDELAVDAEKKMEEVAAVVDEKPSVSETKAMAVGLEHLRQSKAAKPKASQGSNLPKVTKPISAPVRAPATTQGVQNSPAVFKPIASAPVVAPKPVSRKNQRWIKDLSGEHVGIYMGQQLRKEDDCRAYDCTKPKPKDYSVVGVVMETDRFERRSDPLMDGGMATGDSQKRPIVYVK